MIELIKIIKEKIKKHNHIYLSNESAVRTQLIEPILIKLGYDVVDPESVIPNKTGDDGKIPDYSIYKNGKVSIILEDKSLSGVINDPKIIGQIGNYTHNNDVQ
jgi:predicted type IV restriction endonuclease